MRIVCLQTILMKHYTLFFSKIGKDGKFIVCSVVFGALRVNTFQTNGIFHKATYNEGKNGPFYILRGHRL